MRGREKRERERCVSGYTRPSASSRTYNKNARNACIHHEDPGIHKIQVYT
jgi:hypothetical protein